MQAGARNIAARIDPFSMWLRILPFISMDLKHLSFQLDGLEPAF